MESSRTRPGSPSLDSRSPSDSASVKLGGVRGRRNAGFGVEGCVIDGRSDEVVGLHGLGPLLEPFESVFPRRVRSTWNGKLHPTIGRRRYWSNEGVGELLALPLDRSFGLVP